MSSAIVRRHGNVQPYIILLQMKHKKLCQNLLIQKRGEKWRSELNHSCSGYQSTWLSTCVEWIQQTCLFRSITFPWSAVTSCTLGL